MNDTKKEGYNIFIIDDDKFLLDMYSLKFNESEFNVDTAFGSVEALEKLKGGYKPDIILLDIVMPTMGVVSPKDQLSSSFRISARKKISSAGSSSAPMAISSRQVQRRPRSSTRYSRFQKQRFHPEAQ